MIDINLLEPGGGEDNGDVATRIIRLENTVKKLWAEKAWLVEALQELEIRERGSFQGEYCCCGGQVYVKYSSSLGAEKKCTRCGLYWVEKPKGKASHD